MVKMEDIDSSEIQEIKVNMVVLNSSFRPTEGNEELANVLGIELDEAG